jgi:hypothetical protein
VLHPLELLGKLKFSGTACFAAAIHNMIAARNQYASVVRPCSSSIR